MLMELIFLKLVNFNKIFDKNTFKIGVNIHGLYLQGCKWDNEG